MRKRFPPEASVSIAIHSIEEEKRVIQMWREEVENRECLSAGEMLALIHVRVTSSSVFLTET